MESNYKKLTVKITKLEKSKMKKEEKIKELQNSLKEENKELKQLYGFKEAFEKYGVKDLFAYNGAFDKNLLNELASYRWFDIMKIAAYRQYNDKIPASIECCKTGKMKRNYGVEPMMQLLSGNCRYTEVHNALYDAADELEIMRLLGKTFEEYIVAKI